MRTAPFGDVKNMSPNEFFTFFNITLPHFHDTEGNFVAFCENIALLNKNCWTHKVIDPTNPLRRATVLHSLVLSIVVQSKTNEICFHLLNAVQQAAPAEAWDVTLSPAESESAGVNPVFRSSPRSCLFQLCLEAKNAKYFDVLARVLAPLPVSTWCNDIPLYLIAAKKTIESVNDFIPMELIGFLLVLADTRYDFQLWFQSDEVEIPGEPPVVQKQQSLLSSVIVNLNTRMTELRSTVSAADYSLDVLSSASCVAMRKGVTALLQILYCALKSSPAELWPQSLLGELIDLALQGYEHSIVVQLVQYLVSISSAVARHSISDKKSAVERFETLALIAQMLNTDSVVHPIDLKDSFELFCGSVGRSYLVVQILDSTGFMQELHSARSEDELHRLLSVLKSTLHNPWGDRIVDAAGSEFIFLYAVIMILKKKLSNDFLALARVLNTMADMVPAMVWSQAFLTHLSEINHVGTPYHLIWKLCCQLETGDVFLPILSRILSGFLKMQWRDEIDSLIKLALRFLLHQKDKVSISVAAFFLFLVRHISQENDIWFLKVDVKENTQSKNKRSHAAEQLYYPISVLCNTLSVLLKKTEQDVAVVELLLSILHVLVAQSKSPFWLPGAIVERDSPLNVMVQMAFTHSEHAEIMKIFSLVLSKASQEALKTIPVAHRQRLLSLPALAERSTLLSIPIPKPPAPKKVPEKKTPAKKIVAPIATVSVKKPASKPAAKKSVIPAPVKPAEVSSSEKTMPELSNEQLVCTVSLPSAAAVSSPINSDDDGYFPPAGLKRPVVGVWAADFEPRYRHNPYSLYFNRKIITKSDGHVTVSDVVYCTRYKNGVH